MWPGWGAGAAQLRVSLPRAMAEEVQQQHAVLTDHRAAFTPSAPTGGTNWTPGRLEQRVGPAEERTEPRLWLKTPLVQSALQPSVVGFWS